MIKDYLKLHFIVFLWGFTAIIAKVTSLPADAMVLWRTGLAALCLGLWIWYKADKNHAEGLQQSIRLPSLSSITKIMGVGVIVAIHWILFFESTKVSKVSICLVGMSTASFFTAIVEPFFKRKKIQPFELILGLVALAGLYVVFRAEFSYALGLWLALGSAFLAALFSTLNSQLVTREDPFVITFFEMMAACIITGLYLAVGWALGRQIHVIPTAMDWVYLLPLVLLCTVYAFVESVALLKRIPVFAMNFTTNLEPVYGIGFAVLFFPASETLTAEFYLGASVILVSVLSYPILKLRLSKQR